MSWRALGVALVLSWGCGENQREALGEALESYNDYLRWGRWNRAAAFLSRELRADFVTRAGGHRDLKITDYQIGDLQLRGEDRAEALIQIEWYSLSGARLRRSVIRQTWLHREHRWRLQAQRQVGGDPFPLVGPGR
jgi:hypothetical protein